MGCELWVFHHRDPLTALAIDGLTFTGADTGDFASPSNAYAGSLAAKAHGAISLKLTPAAKGKP
jgi:hypothetical protein